MFKVIFMVIFLVFNLAIIINGNEKSGSADRLRKDLMSKYDKSTPPKLNQNKSVTVNTRFLLKYFTYDMYEHTLSVHNWLIMIWDDERLKWNPEDYSQLTKISVYTDDIWSPNLSELSRSDLSGNLKALNAINCLVHPTGTIICIIPAGHNGLCVADLLFYPFDKQTCVVTYGSWADVTNVDFKLAKNGNSVSVQDFTPNPEWNLLNAGVEKITEQDNSSVVTRLLKTTYVIQRRNSIFIATIVIPALVIFFRDSMVLCSMHLVLTVIFNKIIQIKSQCPNFIVNFIQKIKTNPVGRFLINSAYSKGLMSSTDTAEEGEEKDLPAENTSLSSWLLVVALLDNTTIVIYFLSYVALFFGFIVV